MLVIISKCAEYFSGSTFVALSNYLFHLQYGRVKHATYVGGGQGKMAGSNEHTSLLNCSIIYCATALSITTFSITIQSIFLYKTRHSARTTLLITTICIQCRYAEYYYDKCSGVFIVMLSVVMLIVVLLIVTTPNMLKGLNVLDPGS